MTIDSGRSGSGEPSGLRPFGAEPATQSQAEPLVPNAVIAPLPDPKRVAAIARLATTGLDGLCGPPAWGCSQIAARHGYLYGWYEGLARAVEVTAAIAEQWRDENKSAAAQARKRRDETSQIMADQLDGAAIECNAIAGEIRKLASGIEAATADETRSGSAEGESPTAESRDAKTPPGEE